MWAFLRALDDEEPHPRLWAFVLAASLGVGPAAEEPDRRRVSGGAALLYLAVTRQLFSRETWKRLHPFSGIADCSG